ncbi:hypothetical protein CTI12_AA131480 [Artemisia annua]|uniref:Uncharacterized protein n=1 Tax=Artemisia annua TaxID=35608 RepID=A0A2U1PNJ6_ARTAN|nr:hypothetical protein CTI12_AA131480 [Artemisia annua]
MIKIFIFHLKLAIYASHLQKIALSDLSLELQSFCQKLVWIRICLTGTFFGFNVWKVPNTIHYQELGMSAVPFWYRTGLFSGYRIFPRPKYDPRTEGYTGTGTRFGSFSTKPGEVPFSTTK